MSVSSASQFSLIVPINVIDRETGLDYFGARYYNGAQGRDQRGVEESMERSDVGGRHGDPECAGVAAIHV
jgi:hypothetical protein